MKDLKIHSNDNLYECSLRASLPDPDTNEPFLPGSDISKPNIIMPYCFFAGAGSYFPNFVDNPRAELRVIPLDSFMEGKTPDRSNEFIRSYDPASYFPVINHYHIPETRWKPL
jgi:hypothetical protein